MNRFARFSANKLWSIQSGVDANGIYNDMFLDPIARVESTVESTSSTVL